MPKITEYTQQVDQQPLNIVQPEVGLYTAGGKAFSEVAKEVDDITKKFEQVRNEQETSKTSADLQIELDQIKDQAGKDPDFNNISGYRSKVDKAIAKNIGNISSEQARQKVADSFRLKGYSTFSDIESTFNTRKVEQAQFDFNRELDGNYRLYISEVNPANKTLLMTQSKDAINAKVASGIITAEKGAEYFKSFDKWDTDWQKTQINAAIINDPKTAKEMMASGQFGDLNAEERNKWGAVADSYEKRIKVEADIKAKNEQIKNEFQAVDSLSKGEMDFANASDIVYAADQGLIGKDFAQAWIKYATNPDSIDLSKDSQGFSEYVKAVFDSKGENRDEQIRNTIVEALSGKRNTHLKQAQMQDLIKIAGMRAKDKTAKQEEADALFRNTYDWASKVNISADNKDKMVKEFIDGIGKDMKSSVLFDQVTRNALVREHPELASKEFVPNSVYTPQEGLYFVFNSNTNVTPHALYNPKTGKMEPNPDNVESVKK
jgi:hypothetical protein